MPNGNKTALSITGYTVHTITWEFPLILALHISSICNHSFTAGNLKNSVLVQKHTSNSTTCYKIDAAKCYRTENIVDL